MLVCAVSQPPSPAADGSSLVGEATLIGRDGELHLLTSALDGLPGRGCALALRGEAGIGKSVLLDAARELAGQRGIQVLSTAGVRAESDLAYSGLHRLLWPVFDGVGELSPAHRSALLAACGVGEHPGGEPFLVALATLELLSSRAAERPLLVVVDDLPWLDAVSREVIAFVGRRVESDPIVVLVAIREGYDEELGELGFPEYVLHRLPDVAASALLDARVPDLDPAIRARVLAEAAGNPLALVELPMATADAAADRVANLAAVPLTTRLERTFAARLGDIPEETKSLLLIAAADESEELAEILAAGEILLGRPASLAALRPAIEARLAAPVDGRLHFRHPLVRSAVYQAADFERRTAAHAALAQLFAEQPDRRAWHRAAATMGRDDSVAQDLEEMAWRVHRRGAVLEAATSLGRAAQLSDNRPERARRLLRAGELAFQVGRADLVRAYVEEARQLNLSTHDQARAGWLSEIFYDGVPGDAERVLSLVNLAEQAREDDLDLALTLLHAAALRSWWGDPGAAVRRQVVAAVERVGVDQGDSRALVIVAMAEPIARSASVMAGVERASRLAREDPDVALRLGMASHAVGDFERSMRILPLAVDPLRTHGRFGLLTHAVGVFASSAVFVSDWPVVAGAAAEYEQLARETNQLIWRAGAAVMQSSISGVRGHEKPAEAFAAEVERLLRSNRSSDILSVLQNARGLTALAAGRYEDAYSQLARAFDPSDPAYHYREKYCSVGNLAEAALHTGRQEEIRRLVAGLDEEAELSADRALLQGLHYARAALADDDRAEAEFERALKAVGPRWAFNHARINLAYGAWLRRQRRVSDSRGPLRAARDAFDRLDVPAWGERARQELRASGETSRKRRPEAWDQLSPQELQIATLAASGLSNREIGQRLYLSHRTVASHLYRMFPKLGITSRSQLSAVLPEQSRADSG
jgi:DNA-binding CsgD family transcriptional regulator